MDASHSYSIEDPKPITTNNRRLSVWQLKGLETKTITIENLDDKQKPQPKTIGTVTIKMIASLTGNFFQSLLSIFSCIIYVLGTYETSSDSFTEIEYAIAALFSVDYLWGFSIAKDKRAFMLHPMNVVDLMSILPVFLNLFTVSDKQSQQGNSLMFTRIIRIIRVVRILRLYRLFTVT